jgi:hypothetical protein
LLLLLVVCDDCDGEAVEAELDVALEDVLPRMIRLRF